MAVRHARVLPTVYVLFFLGLPGCGGNRLDQIERSINDLRAIQAEHTAALSEVRTELRQLSGKMEELQYVSLGKAQQLEQKLKQVSARVPPPAGVPEDLLNRDETAISAHSGPAADEFRTGLQQIRTGEFENAVRTFQSFVDANPGTAFTDNALLWIGIAQEALGRFDRSIVAYSDVFQRFPGEDMVPAALFFLAGVFEKMGSRNDAVLTLEKLIDDHPRSAFGETARARLKQLNPATRKKGR